MGFGASACLVAPSSFPKEGGGSPILRLLPFWGSRAVAFPAPERPNLLNFSNNSSLPGPAPSSVPSRCSASRRLQQAPSPALRDLSPWRGVMAQLPSAALPSPISELGPGPAPLSLGNRVPERANDEGVSQTSVRSPLTRRQPRWSCPSNKSAPPLGLSGDPLCSRCPCDA